MNSAFDHCCSILYSATESGESETRECERRRDADDRLHEESVNKYALVELVRDREPRGSRRYVELIELCAGSNPMCDVDYIVDIVTLWCRCRATIADQ